MKLSQEVLIKIGFTDTEASVFTAMLSGNLKVKEVIQATGLQRSSIYHAISNLEKRGLIGRIQVGEYNRWKVSSLEKLSRMVEEKRSELDHLSDEVKDFIASVPKLPDSEKTKITYFQGAQSIESVIFNSLYTRDKKILSIAPRNNYFFEAGFDFATAYVTERKARGIHTKNLWEEVFDKKILEDMYKGLSEIRIMPKTMHNAFHTTVFIYDDTVMYIAPKKSNYVVVFQSKEHADLNRALFETLWASSAPVK